MRKMNCKVDSKRAVGLYGTRSIGEIFGFGGPGVDKRGNGIRNEKRRRSLKRNSKNNGTLMKIHRNFVS